MNTTEQSQQARHITAEELALIIKMCRDFRKWSQEQLSGISGLSVRTIQRVEQGESSDVHTKRALARAFELEDIDAFNKPIVVPSPEQLQAEKEKFDKEHVTLAALPLTTGKQFAKLVEVCMMDMADPAFELTREAEITFAEMVDYFREYRDCAELYTEVQKFEIHDALQSYIDELKSHGVSLRYAERKTHITWGTAKDSKPMLVNILYVVGFPLGKEQDHFSVPKSAGVKL
jgi:transcriptional regulator with XRE-family HTH domain